jgi:hypothetical protein
LAVARRSILDQRRMTIDSYPGLQLAELMAFALHHAHPHAMPAQ